MLGMYIKSGQDLLRHASSRLTLDLFTHAVSRPKRDANNKVISRPKGGSLFAARQPKWQRSL
jgi:hypothetical protein